MTPTHTQIAADILARGAGASEKQAAFIGRLLARNLATQARHGVPFSAARYASWIDDAATPEGANDTIRLLLDAPRYAIRA